MTKEERVKTVTKLLSKADENDEVNWEKIATIVESYYTDDSSVLKQTTVTELITTLNHTVKELNKFFSIEERNGDLG